MASTYFIDGQTLIPASWLNDVNALTYSGGGAGVAWGAITGTLANQTDLQNALNLKAPIASPSFTGTVTFSGGISITGGQGTSGQVLTSAGIGSIPTWTTLGGGSGTVTSVSVSSANGFAGTIATPTTTPAITLTTSITGILKGNGTAISAATNADLPVMTATVGGAVPTPPNNTTTYLRGDGTFATPAGSGDMVLSGTQTVTGAKTFNNNTLVLAGSTSGTTTLQATAVAGTGTVVFPTTGTLTTLAGSEAFTNKTYNGNTWTAGTGVLTIATGKTATHNATTTFAGTDGKTLTISNSLTLAGTDSTVMTFPTVSSNVGYLEIPQNSQSAAYTLVLTDSGKHIYHPSADTTARTWTIPANSSVAYPIGTALTFVNDTSGGVITIAITTDTMILAGAGTTGSRTLAANGVATALKMTSTRWIISGTGLT